MDGQKSSLIDPPTSLKDAIDWIALVCGYGKGSRDMKAKLATAVSDLTNFETAFKGKFGTVNNPEGFINKLGKCLGEGFLGYSGQAVDEFSGSGIAMSGYQSTYKDANWSASDTDLKQYAKIFLFLAPLVYYFVSFFYWACKKYWRRQNLRYISNSGLYYFMVAMGYIPSLLDEKKTGFQIGEHLESSHNGFDELKIAYESSDKTSYDAFLQQLEGNGSKHALSCPLTSCYKLATAYFEKQANAITAAIDAIKEELKELSNRRDITSTNNFYILQQKIETLLRKIQSFNPNSGSSGSGSSEPGSDGLQKVGSSGTGSQSQVQSSPAGPAVGGLLGVGTLGAGAAYGLNLDTPLSSLADPYFDCLSNLKDVIDWILRATGKDRGGSGSDNSQKLAQAIVALPDFTKAIKAAVNKLKESESGDVSEAIQKLNDSSTLDEIIKKLADGLKDFIGYGAVEEGGVEVSQALQKLHDESSLGPIITKLADGLGNFIGYEGADGKIRYDRGIGQRPKNQRGNGDANDGKRYESREVFLSARQQKQASVGYYLSYNPSHASWESWNATDAKAIQCAKIFLGVIPLIFSKLSYLYWRCHSSGGGWNGQSLINGDLGNFVYALDYHFFNLNVQMTGDKIVQTAMNGKFQDFAEGMTTAQQTAKTRAGKEDAAKKNIYMDAQFQVNQNPTYLEFIAGCNEKLNDKIKTASNPSSDLANHSLSALHLLASWYFRSMQSKSNAVSSRPPFTIREMLYFLAALPYSPNDDSLDSHISNYFKKISNQFGEKYDAELMIAVADSSTNQQHNTLSAADLKYHLMSTCSFSTAVLGMIQGPGASTGSDPWLYEMYCNSAFNLTYGSGAALFNAIAKYSYAVQFQMNFLYWQCYNNGMRCGWQYCTFGSAFTPQKESEVVTSHLCHADCTSHTGVSGKCVDHSPYTATKCGKSPNQSPLQAFLTDCLSGFCRNIPGTSNHLTTCSGPCHAPMGFKAVHLRGVTKIGRNIMSALIPFCSSENSPLTQLSEKLGCLTKRTPRTLGDLFGFIWHLNGQLFKSGVSAEVSVKEFIKSLGLSSSTSDVDLQANPSSFLSAIQNKVAALGSSTKSGLERSLISLFPGLPFWYNIFMVKPGDSLPVRLFQLKSTDHRPGGTSKYSGGHNDLYSLYNQSCSGRNNCGSYLRPLCYSNGATYAPTHASSYLSWVLYLSDDLSVSFGEMLHEFNNIDCSTSNCRHFSPGKICSANHQLGKHGSSDVDCQCESVVECGGTLPLLYSHGYNYYNAFVLMGGTKQSGQGVKYNGPTKRSCEKFHNTLTAVLKPEAPLDNLITTIDTFLYAIRWEFFSKLSSFWTIYISLILYTFFFLLDTLHFRSHLKLTSSHAVPPLSLLISGTPLPITKLTYLSQ
ncbi:variant erythrocyte surface antigen-1 family protein [Babesia caballi]|uniref:Variant erythrocyte surface antigen-1 family protein n=1 Tax=Babesia caballi TaxID=5871 RepID=A0AAV4LWY5_BABCB|nr:variant erythrocyte surface antigen-1 family protein [Babesia caballi]